MAGKLASAKKLKTILLDSTKFYLNDSNFNAEPQWENDLLASLQQQQESPEQSEANYEYYNCLLLLLNIYYVHTKNPEYKRIVDFTHKLIQNNYLDKIYQKFESLKSTDSEIEKKQRTILCLTIQSGLKFKSKFADSTLESMIHEITKISFDEYSSKLLIGVFQFALSFDDAPNASSNQLQKIISGFSADNLILNLLSHFTKSSKTIEDDVFPIDFILTLSRKIKKNIPLISFTEFMQTFHYYFINVTEYNIMNSNNMEKLLNLFNYIYKHYSTDLLYKNDQKYGAWRKILVNPFSFGIKPNYKSFSTHLTVLSHLSTPENSFKIFNCIENKSEAEINWEKFFKDLHDFRVHNNSKICNLNKENQLIIGGFLKLLFKLGTNDPQIISKTSHYDWENYLINILQFLQLILPIDIEIHFINFLNIFLPQFKNLIETSFDNIILKHNITKNLKLSTAILSLSFNLNFQGKSLKAFILSNVNYLCQNRKAIANASKQKDVSSLLITSNNNNTTIKLPSPKQQWRTIEVILKIAKLTVQQSRTSVNGNKQDISPFLTINNIYKLFQKAVRELENRNISDLREYNNSVYIILDLFCYILESNPSHLSKFDKFANSVVKLIEYQDEDINLFVTKIIRLLIDELDTNSFLSSVSLLKSEIFNILVSSVGDEVQEEILNLLLSFSQNPKNKPITYKLLGFETINEQTTLDLLLDRLNVQTINLYPVFSEKIFHLIYQLCINADICEKTLILLKKKNFFSKEYLTKFFSLSAIIELKDRIIERKVNENMDSSANVTLDDDDNKDKERSYQDELNLMSSLLKQRSWFLKIMAIEIFISNEQLAYDLFSNHNSSIILNQIHILKELKDLEISPDIFESFFIGCKNIMNSSLLKFSQLKQFQISILKLLSHQLEILNGRFYPTFIPIIADSISKMVNFLSFQNDQKDKHEDGNDGDKENIQSNHNFILINNFIRIFQSLIFAIITNESSIETKEKLYSSLLKCLQFIEYIDNNKSEDEINKYDKEVYKNSIREIKNVSADRALINILCKDVLRQPKNSLWQSIAFVILTKLVTLWKDQDVKFLFNPIFIRQLIDFDFAQIIPPVSSNNLLLINNYLTKNKSNNPTQSNQNPSNTSNQNSNNPPTKTRIIEYNSNEDDIKIDEYIKLMYETKLNFLLTIAETKNGSQYLISQHIITNFFTKFFEFYIPNNLQLYYQLLLPAIRLLIALIINQPHNSILISQLYDLFFLNDHFDLKVVRFLDYSVAEMIELITSLFSQCSIYFSQYYTQSLNNLENYIQRLQHYHFKLVHLFDKCANTVKNFSHLIEYQSNEYCILQISRNLLYYFLNHNLLFFSDQQPLLENKMDDKRNYGVAISSAKLLNFLNKIIQITHLRLKLPSDKIDTQLTVIIELIVNIYYKQGQSREIKFSENFSLLQEISVCFLDPLIVFNFINHFINSQREIFLSPHF